jgi:hypothetical protein
VPSPPLVVTNAVQLRLLGTAANQGSVQVLHASKGSGLVISQALTNTVGAAIKAAWTSRFGTLMTSGASLVRVGLRDLTAAAQPEFLDTGAPVGGTATGDSLPPQLAACVTLRTALSGKSFRGRTYFSGFGETENVAGANMSAASAAAVVSFVGDIQAALTASGLTLAILSRPSYAFVDTRVWTLPNGSTQTDTLGRGNQRPGAINAVTVVQNRDTRWETQRRRNNARGAAPTFLSNGVTLDLLTGELSTPTP